MRRRVAVLSDVHGHLEALRAVLVDADAAGADEVVVAGDSVNFGPDSGEVVDLLRQRGARMIRGNHEQEWAATYGTPAAPAALTGSPRFAPTRWVLEALGPARRAFLAVLPDRLLLDEATVVAHGSPRHVRDSVLATTPDAELAAMLPDPGTRLAFVGHTHRPLIRDLPGPPPHRFVNVGSVGHTIDGDPRAAYALAEPGPSGAPGDWRVTLRRVPYDIDAALAAYDRGMRAACPEFVELFVREIRTGRPYFAPGLRATAGVPDGSLRRALCEFLARNP